MSHRLLITLVLMPLVAGCVFSGEQIRHEVDSIAWDLRPDRARACGRAADRARAAGDGHDRRALVR